MFFRDFFPVTFLTRSFYLPFWDLRGMGESIKWITVAVCPLTSSPIYNESSTPQRRDGVRERPARHVIPVTDKQAWAACSQSTFAQTACSVVEKLSTASDLNMARQCSVHSRSLDGWLSQASTPVARAMPSVIFLCQVANWIKKKSIDPPRLFPLRQIQSLHLLSSLCRRVN